MKFIPRLRPQQPSLQLILIKYNGMGRMKEKFMEEQERNEGNDSHYYDADDQREVQKFSQWIDEQEKQQSFLYRTKRFFQNTFQNTFQNIGNSVRKLFSRKKLPF